MSEKVVITKKQAGMIENHRGSFDLLMKKRVEDNCPTVLDDLSIETVARAYIEGYEIEKTPSEKLLEAYERQVSWSETNNTTDHLMHKAYANGIRFTLNMLGVVVCGINDSDEEDMPA